MKRKVSASMALNGKPLLNKYYFAPLYSIFISLLLFGVRDLAAARTNPLTLANLNRVVGIPIAIIFVCLFFVMRKRHRKLSMSLKLFFVYLLVGLFSSYFFSDWLLYSIWKLVEVLSVVLIGVYVWSLALRDKAIVWKFYEKTMSFYKFILLTVVASVVCMPEASINLASSVSDAFLPYRISGQFVKVNAISIGTLSAFIIYAKVISFYYTDVVKISKTDCFWLILSVILLVFSQSRTAFVGLLVALVMFMVVTKRSNFSVRFFLLLSSILIVYLFFPYISSYLQRGQSAAGIYALSGRFTWWKYAFDAMLESDLPHQLLGFGFGIGDRIMANLSSGDMMQTLDSTYMSSLVSTGMIGTSILVLLIGRMNIQLINLLRTNPDSIAYAELLGVSVILTIKSLTTSTVNVFTFYTILFVLINVFISDKREPFVS